MAFIGVWLLFLFPAILVWGTNTVFASQQEVDLELVLALDVSGSVDAGEYELQTEGLARAFENPEILSAIKRAGGRGISVAVVQWSSPDEQWLAINWKHLQDASELSSFAERLRNMPRRYVAGDTVLSNAMKFSGRQFSNDAYFSRRRVIDVSADGGVENLGLTVAARNTLVLEGIVINGLAIETDVDNLKEFFRDHVIGGKDAFVMSVASYQDFDVAILRKLIREIAPLRLSNLMIDYF
jgi:Ca-activated chloride channel family protein